MSPYKIPENIRRLQCAKRMVRQIDTLGGSEAIQELGRRLEPLLMDTRPPAEQQADQQEIAQLDQMLTL